MIVKNAGDDFGLWWRFHCTESHGLKLMRIHDKPCMLGEFVVEGAAAGVGGLGGPVNAAAATLASGGVHGCNEVCGDALAAMLGGDEEVLQVAHVMQPRGAAVKQVVYQANELLAPSLA